MIALAILMKYWPLVFILINGLFLWVSWSFKKGIVTHVDLEKVTDSVDRLNDELDHRVKQIEDRVLVVEQDLKHAPDNDDLKKLTAQISQLHSEISQVAGGMEGIRRAVDLINTHLLEKK